MKAHVIRSKSFVKDAADYIEKRAGEAIKDRGRFILGLSGGKTPEAVYAELARRDSLDWNKVIITFGDERCVPPDHLDSNYGMAKRSLLDRINIPSENVHRIRGEDKPENAARQYEEELLSLRDDKSENTLHHDLLLLGIGEDGHTASIFPGTAAISVTDRLVTPNFVPQLNSWRVAMTFPLMSASRHVCFLVKDPKKEKIISEILGGSMAYPASHVKALESLTWLIGEQ